MTTPNRALHELRNQLPVHLQQLCGGHRAGLVNPVAWAIAPSMAPVGCHRNVSFASWNHYQAKARRCNPGPGTSYASPVEQDEAIVNRVPYQVSEVHPSLYEARVLLQLSDLGALVPPRPPSDVPAWVRFSQVLSLPNRWPSEHSRLCGEIISLGYSLPIEDRHGLFRKAYEALASLGTDVTDRVLTRNYLLLAGADVFETLGTCDEIYAAQTDNRWRPGSTQDRASYNRAVRLFDAQAALLYWDFASACKALSRIPTWEEIQSRTGTVFLQALKNLRSGVVASHGDLTSLREAVASICPGMPVHIFSNAVSFQAPRRLFRQSVMDWARRAEWMPLPSVEAGAHKPTRFLQISGRIRSEFGWLQKVEQQRLYSTVTEEERIDIAF